MMLSKNLGEQAQAHPRAVQRVHRAQEQLASAERLQADAAGTPRESRAANRVSECSAAVSGREQWLYWIDHKESIRPDADGEWGPQPENEESLRMR